MKALRTILKLYSGNTFMDSPKDIVLLTAMFAGLLSFTLLPAVFIHDGLQFFLYWMALVELWLYVTFASMLWNQQEWLKLITGMYVCRRCHNGLQQAVGRNQYHHGPHCTGLVFWFWVRRLPDDSLPVHIQYAPHVPVEDETQVLP